MNRGYRSGCIAEVRSFAPTNTARATSQADAARESSTPERITSAFVACANLSPNRRNLPKRVWPSRRAYPRRQRQVSSKWPRSKSGGHQGVEDRDSGETCCRTFAKTSTASTGLFDHDLQLGSVLHKDRYRGEHTRTWIGFECTVTALSTCAQSSAARTSKPFISNAAGHADQHLSSCRPTRTLMAIQNTWTRGPPQEKRSRTDDKSPQTQTKLGGSLS